MNSSWQSTTEYSGMEELKVHKKYSTACNNVIFLAPFSVSGNLSGLIILNERVK